MSTGVGTVTATARRWQAVIAMLLLTAGMVWASAGSIGGLAVAACCTVAGAGFAAVAFLAPSPSPSPSPEEEH